MATGDLASHTMPANSFDAAKDGVRITAWGTTANNANAKTITLEFGATTVLSYALTVSQAGKWRIVALVFSTGTDAQKYSSEVLEMAGDNHDIEQGTATEDDGATIEIKCTATAVAENDVTQEGFFIEFLNNP